MGIERTKIHLIDLKQKSFYNLEELKEEMILYVIQPNKEAFSIVLESYYLISSMFKGVLNSIIFIPGEKRSWSFKNPRHTSLLRMLVSPDASRTSEIHS